MSLVIMASKPVIDQNGKVLKDPCDYLLMPSEDDFAYQNDHQKYAADLKEFDRLCNNYDKFSNLAAIGDFASGYMEYSTLLEDVLSSPLGYQYYHPDNDPMRLYIHGSDKYSDKMNKTLLNFFTHSDCDGTLDYQSIHVLNQEVKAHQAEIIANAQKINNSALQYTQKFIDFLNKSDQPNVAWHYC